MPMIPSSKFFWLSFADDAGNLGCCIVAVTEEEADAALEQITQAFPHAAPGAEWIAAAAAKAWEMGCNPGGEMLATPIPDTRNFPLYRLMSKAEAKTLAGEQ